MYAANKCSHRNRQQQKNTGGNTTIKNKGDTKKNNNKSLSTSVEEVSSTKARVTSMPYDHL